MRVALVQLNAKDPLWDVSHIPDIVEAARDADLVVFPEYMPFGYDDGPVPLGRAMLLLGENGKGRKVSHTAFMAGGSVSVSGELRNVAFLQYGGKIYGEYFKRRPWQEDGVVPGAKLVKFSWEKFSCIPLICADAADDHAKRQSKMIAEAKELGASDETPIIVCSYGAWLNEPYWQTPLQTWASECQAPVLICGVSGTGDEFSDNDVPGNYGGGGSGVFWPNGKPPQQREKRGICLVDTTLQTMTYRPIAQVVHHK